MERRLSTEFASKLSLMIAGRPTPAVRTSCICGETARMSVL
jgi:hypothetical protein